MPGLADGDRQLHRRRARPPSGASTTGLSSPSKRNGTPATPPACPISLVSIAEGHRTRSQRRHTRTIRSSPASRTGAARRWAACALITEADPAVVEELKWAKASNLAGVPTWSHDGIICTGEVYKSAVKLTFANGAPLDDPKGLFNSSLEGKTRRAIDLPEGAVVDLRLQGVDPGRRRLQRGEGEGEAEALTATW